MNTIKYFKIIQTTVTEHYMAKGLDVNELIQKDILNSSNNKKEEKLFPRLIMSIHNANWKGKSLNTFWEKHKDNYNSAFNNYDVEYVSNLKVTDLENKGLINSEKKIQSFIDAAKFLIDIKNHSESGIIDFFEKFAYIGSTVYERWALANIISQSIKGMGATLACDFLKETGFLNYGKPDVHIKRIFERIGVENELKDSLLADNDNFYKFRILDFIASEVDMTLFEVDKVLWLFATGYNVLDGESIGGICMNEPQCQKCGLNRFCKKNDVLISN